MVPSHFNLFNIVFKVLARAIRQKQEVNEDTNRKRSKIFPIQRQFDLIYKTVQISPLRTDKYTQ